MGQSESAVETLLFRARVALRREYEKAGGTRFGCGVLGLGLYRYATGGPAGDAPAAHVALVSRLPWRRARLRAPAAGVPGRRPPPPPGAAHRPGRWRVAGPGGGPAGP